MARIRFLDATRNRYVATATVLTASSAATALPVANSQNSDRTKVWRSSTTTGTHTIDVDLGSVLSCSALAVANPRTVGSGVIELYHRGDAGAPGAASLVATLPAADRDTRTAFVFFTAVSHRHWQIKFTNPGATSGYVELGHVHLGDYFEPAQNVLVPADLTREDPTVVTASIDGQETFSTRTKVFRGAWTMQEIPEAQLDTYRANWDALGVSGKFYQVLDTALPWTCWYARQAGDLGIQLSVLAGRYNIGLPWVENR